MGKELQIQLGKTHRKDEEPEGDHRNQNQGKKHRNAEGELVQRLTVEVVVEDPKEEEYRSLDDCEPHHLSVCEWECE